MENPTQFKKTKLLLQFIQGKNEKLNCDELELVKQKRVHFQYHLFCLKETFLTFVFYLNVYWIKHTSTNTHTFTYQQM